MEEMRRNGKEEGGERRDGEKGNNGQEGGTREEAKQI
jgi:hypothetical protein